MTQVAKSLFAAVVFCAFTAHASANSTLGKLEVKKEGQGVDIVVNGENLPKPKVVTAYNGESYILDFEAALEGKPEAINVNAAGIRFAERVWFQKRVRVHVKFNKGEASEPELVEEDGKWHIRVNLPPYAEAQKSKGKDYGDADPEMVRAIEQLANGLPPVKKDEGKGLPMLPLPTPDAGAKKPETGNAATGSKTNAEVVNNTAQTATGQAEPLISLDFVNTDVTQILKALSLESGMNIVAAPDVSPEDKPLKLTIRLENETVENALGYITGISGLRYARQGKTFIVARKENFNDVMSGIRNSTSGQTQTKVVNLMSGEGFQIKEATLQAFPPTGANGYYDIIVQGQDGRPLENVASNQGGVVPQNNPPGANPGGVTPQPQPQPQSNPQGAGEAFFSSRANYVMIVGDPLRVAEIERYVRQIDNQILSTFNINWDESVATVVVPVVSGQTERIKQMLEERVRMSPRSRQITIAETSAQELSQGDVANHMLMMVGPETELEALAAYARAIDRQICINASIPYAPEDRERMYHVADLRYIEPIVAEQDLKGRIRGLHVTVIPDPVTPGATGDDDSSKAENPTDPPGTGTGGTNQQQNSELTRTIGREPMKLMLRGTRQQIDEALQYLAMVDLPRRQAALELRVLELTKEQAQAIGIDWSLLTTGRLQNIRFNQGTDRNAGSPGTVSGDWNYRGGDVASFLATLDKETEGRGLIARPNTFVADGGSSALFVGDTVRYIETIQSTQNGTTVQIGEVKTGVTLNIRARLGADGNMTFALDQEFTILNGFTPVPGGGQIPQTSDRRTSNVLQMRSGEVIALGGLIQEQDRKRVSGIPFLMDLPIIGNLFKRTETSKVRTEIVFILAATEVDDNNRANEADPRNRENQIGGGLGTQGSGNGGGN